MGTTPAREVLDYGAECAVSVQKKASSSRIVLNPPHNTHPSGAAAGKAVTDQYRECAGRQSRKRRNSLSQSKPPSHPVRRDNRKDASCRAILSIAQNLFHNGLHPSLWG
jgi:hypothetical protein